MNAVISQEKPEIRQHQYKGYVHCPMCTHTVESQVVARGRSVFVKPGERCPRCNSALDAGYVLRIDQAA
jgi:uncharacterized protein (UPF0212 family)